MPQLDPENPIVGETSLADILDQSETLGSLVVRLNAFIDAGVPLETKVILGTDPATADADTGSNALRFVEQGHYYEQDFIILGDVSEMTDQEQEIAKAEGWDEVHVTDAP